MGNVTQIFQLFTNNNGRKNEKSRSDIFKTGLFI